MDPLTLLVIGGLGVAAFVFTQKKPSPPVVAPPVGPPIGPPIGPGPSIPTTPGTTPGIPPDLWDRINTMLQTESSVPKLRVLEAELERRKYELLNPPPPPDRQAAVMGEVARIDYALTILRTKIRDLEAYPPTTSTPTTTTPPGEPKPLPQKLQDLLAIVMRELHIQPDGSIVGPVSETAIQAATSLSAQLEAAGFKAYADSLRQWVILASAYVPKPEKKPDAPKPDAVPESLWDRIWRTLSLERDPKVLRGLLAEMQAYRPKSPEMDSAIATLTNLIATIEAGTVISDTIEDIDKDMPKTDTPGTPELPPIAEKTEVERFAEAVVLNLRSVQTKFGMPGAKGKEDTALAKRYQKSRGITQDGKAGPGTMLTIADYVSFLPLVMYWPKGATQKNVTEYKKKLGDLAAASTGIRRDELLESIAREKGQGGVS